MTLLCVTYVRWPVGHQCEQTRKSLTARPGPGAKRHPTYAKSNAEQRLYQKYWTGAGWMEP